MYRRQEHFKYKPLLVLNEIVRDPASHGLFFYDLSRFSYNPRQNTDLHEALRKRYQLFRSALECSGLDYDLHRGYRHSFNLQVCRIRMEISTQKTKDTAPSASHENPSPNSGTIVAPPSDPSQDIMDIDDMDAAASAKKRSWDDATQPETPTIKRKVGGYLTQLLERDPKALEAASPERIERLIDSQRQRREFLQSLVLGSQELHESELVAEERREEERRMERQRNIDLYEDCFVDEVNLCLLTPHRTKRLKSSASVDTTTAAETRPTNQWELQWRSPPSFSIGASGKQNAIRR